ncbi:MAG: 30S ribosomal protein S4 [Aigarchaeota archaeon]|nr:30S ribosomal protein S4 [Aigarchaeota archaeon]MCS7127071.1 30S ribosomal protein S4 [Candidatus Calditenuaceae archaeon]MDW8043195.1 30S ribosomal protein S4 [Nitrososphaerota archaeon]
MGDPKRPRKTYETPRHPWKADRLMEELRLVGEYGLRNKRELWKAQAILRKYRKIARSLFVLTGEERMRRESELIRTLAKYGLVSENATADDVLKLTVRDILERRLQTIVYRMGLARTVYHARQLIVHGHVAIGDQVVSVPGRLIEKGEEGSIRLLLAQKAAQARG